MAKKPRNIAQLRAYDGKGLLVLEESIALDDYYEQSHDLIDSNDFRSQRSIRKVVGQLYGSRGNLSQEFENEYGARGNYLRGRTRHEDGTVTED